MNKRDVSFGVRLSFIIPNTSSYLRVEILSELSRYYPKVLRGYYNGIVIASLINIHLGQLLSR